MTGSSLRLAPVKTLSWYVICSLATGVTAVLPNTVNSSEVENISRISLGRHEKQASTISPFYKAIKRITARLT